MQSSPPVRPRCALSAPGSISNAVLHAASMLPVTVIARSRQWRRAGFFPGGRKPPGRISLCLIRPDTPRRQVKKAAQQMQLRSGSLSRVLEPREALIDGGLNRVTNRDHHLLQSCYLVTRRLCLTAELQASKRTVFNRGKTALASSIFPLHGDHAMLAAEEVEQHHRQEGYGRRRRL